jgi:hypothetical protein
MIETAARNARPESAEAREHAEGPVARAIEEQTAKLPSDLFLWAAGGSILTSLALKMMGKDHHALFVGQWAPTLLILGLYNKVVKVAGSDRTDPAR